MTIREKNIETVEKLHDRLYDNGLIDTGETLHKEYLDLIREMYDDYRYNNKEKEAELKKNNKTEAGK